MESFARKFGVTYIDSLTASDTVTLKIAKLSMNQNKLNILLLVHHKFQKNNQATINMDAM
jgi:hypothetical protein